MLPFLHVKWFSSDYGDMRGFQALLDLHPTGLKVWLVVAALLLITAFILNKKIPAPCEKLSKKVQKNENKLIYLFQALVGLCLVGASIGGFLIAPHILVENSTLKPILAVLQGVAGVSLLLNLWPYVGAGLLLTLYLALVVIAGPLAALDYLNVLGVALFIAIWTHKDLGQLKQLGLRFLSFSTGLTLVILAFSEKLLEPGLALSFLEKHDMNFMKVLGFEFFSNELFILSAGIMEMVFGLIMMSGLIPRINILTLLGFFLATNSYFFFAGNYCEALTELIGHLPVVATVIAVVAFGAGKWKRER